MTKYLYGHAPAEWRYFMVLPRLGRWSIASIGMFTWVRLYWRGYKWTPFCLIMYKTGASIDIAG